MKKSSIKTLRRLLCFGLILTLMLSPAFSVFAADEISEEQNNEGGQVNELSTQETPPAQLSASPEPAEPKSPEPASEEPAKPAVEETQEAASEEPAKPAVEETPEVASKESAEPAIEETPETASEEPAEPAIEETPEAASQQSLDSVNDTEFKEAGVVAEDSSATEQSSAEIVAGVTSAPVVAAPSMDKSTKSAAKSSSSRPIHIGDTQFSSEADESSHWSEGKGWKNIAGKYIAMVDYDGSAAEISADGGVVALAVAGVNRIGKLTSNCSYQISGTGIVLIDSIEIEDGNTITLHPDSTLYNEGSAAVFLKQGNSYILINGGITGILDEVYELDNINLVIPKDSSLTISVAGVRTETWDDEEGIKEDVTFYLTDLPYDANQPVHDNGRVEITEYVGNVVLGNNSTLTIDQGASIQMNKISTGFNSIEAELIVKGVLNVLGIVEGGFIDVKNSGSVTGNGTIRSAEVDMDPEGTMSTYLLLDKSGLTINGDRTIIPPMLKDSVIYLKGSDITIPELNASGVSLIGVNTTGSTSSSGNYSIGDITISSGGSLEIICNDHLYGDDWYSRLLEDSSLEISGKITGGSVHVLGGGVYYTGNQTDILPVVPDGYASRVFVSGINTDASLYPLNMTAAKADELLKSDKIPFARLTVNDSLISEQILKDILGDKLSNTWFYDSRQNPRNILGRAWDVTWDFSSIDTTNIPETIDRENNKEFTCASFLEQYGMTGVNNPYDHFTAVEVIRSDLTRERFFIGDTRSIFYLNDAIMVRVLDCKGQGGQGGSAATHTNASFTGNGVIGGTGSGYVHAGSGKVVFGKTSYIEPEPSPEPDNDNTDNTSTDSNSSNKTTPPDKKENSNNTTPSDNKENSNNTIISGNKENSSKTVKTNTGKALVSSVNANGLVVTVTPVVRSTEEQNKADPKLPQIYQLDVTNAGIPVTDLKGNPVKVTFPFTVPESWGDPEKITNDSLYAVFADETDNLTAYSAEYDSETGEISFESEQTGDFVIVRFEYEDEPFTDDFYHALADLEEIQLFLSLLRE